MVTYGDEDTYTLGGATLTAWCKGDESWNCNERSAIWKVSFGDATALLTADMMLKTQKRLLEAIPAQDLQVDILKYPHHGLNKLNDDFYKAVSPGYAVITNNGTKSAPAKQYLRTKHVPFALTVPGFVSWRHGRKHLAHPAPDPRANRGCQRLQRPASGGIILQPAVLRNHEVLWRFKVAAATFFMKIYNHAPEASREMSALCVLLPVVSLHNL